MRTEGKEEANGRFSAILRKRLKGKVSQFPIMENRTLNNPCYFHFVMFAVSRQVAVPRGNLTALCSTTRNIILDRNKELDVVTDL